MHNQLFDLAVKIAKEVTRIFDNSVLDEILQTDDDRITHLFKVRDLRNKLFKFRAEALTLDDENAKVQDSMIALTADNKQFKGNQLSALRLQDIVYYSNF